MVLAYSGGPPKVNWVSDEYVRLSCNPFRLTSVDGLDCRGNSCGAQRCTKRRTLDVHAAMNALTLSFHKDKERLANERH